MAKTPAQRQREYRDRKRAARLAAVPAPPAAAAGLPAPGPAGQQLRDYVTGGWDLGAHEELILRQACRAADRLDAIETELASAPLTVRDRWGTDTTHPLVIEARQQALLLSRLCAGLGLPAGDEDTTPARSARRTHRGGHRGFYNLGA